MYLLKNNRYEEIKRVVADVIQDANISEYPFNVFLIAKKLDIIIIEYQSFSKEIQQKFLKQSEDGFSYYYHNKDGYNLPRIIYNKNNSEKRIKFTIMHEIGHLLLNHCDKDGTDELEANFFAKYILAPPIIINHLNLHDSVSISKIFDISTIMATYQLDYYNKWLKFKNNPLKDYDKRILNQYLKKQNYIYI